MSLEEEAWRLRGPPAKGRSGVRLSPVWEGLIRVVALGILLVAAAASVAVFVFLLGPWGLVAVLALVLLGVVALAGRHHELRVRVDALEERVERVTSDGGGPTSGPPEPPEPEA